MTVREARRTYMYWAPLCGSHVAALISGSALAYIEFSPKMRKRDSVNYTYMMYT